MKTIWEGDVPGIGRARVVVQHGLITHVSEWCGGAYEWEAAEEPNASKIKDAALVSLMRRHGYTDTMARAASQGLERQLPACSDSDQAVVLLDRLFRALIRAVIDGPPGPETFRAPDPLENGDSIPTREQLAALLWSDPAAEAWAGDALEVLHHGDDRLDGVRSLIEMVSTETGCAEIDGEDDAEDLRDFAMVAKRGALVLLHGAFAAERGDREREAEHEQLGIPLAFAKVPLGEDRPRTTCPVWERSSDISTGGPCGRCGAPADAHPKPGSSS